MRDLQMLQTQLGRTATAGNTAGAGAAVLGGVDKGINAVQNAAAAGFGALSKLQTAIGSIGSGMSAFGKNLQWTGRQLEYSFTLPLVAAGGFAAKWAMENDAAMTRVRKVYGDGTESVGQLNAELNALSKTFELLSSIYGVQQSQVIQIAEAWAQAGSAGAGLGKSVRNTLDLMILGGQDWEKSVEGLIAVQATYGLSTSELRDQIAILNAIENQTGANMGDLITVIQKAGGAARFAGVDIRHLAAFASALIPATGSAATAGDALKTVISRLVAPTKDVIEALGFLGINIYDAGWQSSTATERLEKLAGSFDKVTPAQQALLASVIAGRRQFNKLEVELDAVGNSASYYHKALAATADQQQANATYAKELTTFLSSQPQGFKVLTQTLKNLMSQAIVPLLPALAGLLQRVVMIVKAFTDLPPETQQLILMGLVLLALIGPITRITGAFFLLGGTIVNVFSFSLKAIIWFVSNGFTLISTFVSGVAKLFNFLAPIIVRAFVGGYNAIVTGLTAIYNFLMGLRAKDVVTEGAAMAAKSGMQAGYWVIVTERQAAEAAGEATVAAAYVGAAAISAEAWVTANGIIAASSQGASIASIGGMRAIGPAAGAATASAGSAFTALEGTVVSSSSTAGAASAAGLGVPILVVIAAIVAAIGVLLYIFNEDFRTAVNNAAKAFWDWLQALPGPVRWAIESILSPLLLLGDVINTIFPPIQTAVANLFRGLVSDVQAVFRFIGQLPSFIGQVFSAVVRIIAKAITIVVGWLSYLNPWARHSPSLVDNVTSGVAEILNQYSKLNGISSVLAQAAAAHRNFLAATGGTSGPAREAMKRADDRKVVAETQPQALPAFDALVYQIGLLKDLLPQLKAQVDAQKAVVDSWQDKLDAVNKELDAQNKILDQYKDHLNEVETALSDAKQGLNDLAEVGITGMRAMEDAAFENEMAQKRLQLQMMDWEDVHGAIEETKDKLADLQGALEDLYARREDLRQAGAGSDVLGGLDQMISDLEAQRQALESGAAGDQYEKMKKQLDDLKRQAERIDLEKSINFDPQLRQIDQMINGLNELPFDEIVTRITNQKNLIAGLEAQQRDANAAVKAQEGILDSIKARRDAIQETLDAEKDKLEEIQDAYNDVNQAISDMESSLSDALSALKALKEEKGKDPSDLAKQFAAGAAGDFEIPGGTAGIGREGGLPEIEGLNDELQKQLDETLAKMGDLDPLKPLKEAWGTATGWLKDKWDTFTNFMADKWSGTTSFLSDVWGSITGGISDKWSGTTSFISDVWNSVTSGIADKWQSWVAGPLYTAWETAKGWWNTFTTFISDKWNEYVQPVIDMLVNVWNETIVPAIQSFANFMMDIWTNYIAAPVLWFWNTVLWPVVQFIIDAVNNYLVPIFQLWQAIATIVWTMTARAIQWAWENIDVVFKFLGAAIYVVGWIFMWLWNNVVQPVWDGIQNAIKWAWDNVISKVFDAIGFAINILGIVFSWLLHNVIEPIWGGIQWVISWTWNNVIRPIFDQIGAAINILGYVFGWLNSNVVQPVWQGIQNAISWAWNAVISPVLGWIGDGLRRLADVFFWLKDNVVAPVWDGIQRIISAAWNNIAAGIERMVNGAIGGFNTLADGVRGVADALHIPVSINRMPEVNLPRMATGGLIPATEVGAGFLVNRARAIVGEGSPMHPEFVIPTDPRYRQNALSLLALLAAELDVVPKLASGGVFGNVPHMPSQSTSGRIETTVHNSKTIHFHGDLSFPNITSPDQASEFIDNLAALVG